MPANAARHAITRQWELLKHLPSTEPGTTAADLRLTLAGLGYAVSKRTVERDLEGLEALFPITHGDDEPYRWHWVKGGAMGVLGLSTADALSLHLLERFLQPILPAAMTRQLEPAFALARDKLAAQQGRNTLGRWATKVAIVDPSLQVLPARIDGVAMQAVQEALLAEETVEVHYLSPGRVAARAHTLHPLGLVQCGPITYLVATAGDYTDVRTWAMHRMRVATRLHAPARVPSDFQLSRFIDGGGLQFGVTGRIRLKARLSGHLAGQVAETRLADDQSLVPDGDDRFLLTATVQNSWRLQWWLLSKTGDIEVLLPKALRRQVGDLLTEAADLYASPAVERVPRSGR